MNRFAAMKIETLSNGSRLVKRYRRGRCYACVWAPGTSESRIQCCMATGHAEFFPYNETTGEFMITSALHRPSHFTK